MELSSHCNLSCAYCYHAGSTPFKKGFMSNRTANRILEQASHLGVHSLKFNWRGESTVNPDFFQIVSSAFLKAKGMTFMDRISNSNFQFIKNRDLVLTAMTMMTKVKVSFDSFMPEVLEKQRSGAQYNIIYKNIDDFYNHPNRKNTELVIQAVRTKLNKNEDILHETKKRWPEATVSIRDMVGGRIDGDLDEYLDKERNFKDRIPCKQAFARLIFDYEGNAYPCCPDVKGKLFLGNIHSNSIYQMWNSQRAKLLRKTLKDGSAFNHEPCKNCSSFESFDGYKPEWQS